MKNKGFNFKNLLKYKKTNGLIIFIMALCTFNIGFSAWAIMENNTTQSSLTIEVDNTLDIDSFFTFQPIQMFQISKQGIVEDEMFVYEGDIRISFYVTVKDGVLSFLTSDQLNLNIYLRNSGSFNLFSAEFMQSETPTIQYNVSSSYSTNPDLSNTIEGTLQNGAILSKISYLDENLSNINLLFYTLVYHFDFSAYADSFETAIYNQIPDDGIELNISIGVDTK